MNELWLASGLFLATHVGVSSTPLRGVLLARLGERPYLGLYSLVATATLVWMVIAYRAAPFEPVWVAGPLLRAVPLVAMPVALLGIVTGLTAPNPSLAGRRPVIDHANPARGLLRVTRHPLLWSLALWAAAHMLANGDAASLVFFGALLALALAGTRLIDRRRGAEQSAGWDALLAVTSNLPFRAILTGRNRLHPGEIGWRRLALALALYAALIALHPWLFGVRAY